MPRAVKTRRPRAAGAIALIIVAALIAYGSLYPFHWRDRHEAVGAVSFLLGTWRTWDRRGDLLANIILYLPFGFFGVHAVPSRLGRAARLALPILAGACFSVAMELMQFHIAGRVTSMGDVYANTIGTALGAAAGTMFIAPWRWAVLADLAGHAVEAMLIAAWLGYRLYPFVPTIDLHKYWRAIRPLIMAPSLPGLELPRFTILWLVIAWLTESIFGPRRWLLLFPLLAGTEMAGRIIVVHGRLTLPDIAGAVLAGVLWLMLRRIPGRTALLAVLWLALVVGSRLAPFTFTASARAFGWVPFAGFLRGSIAVAAQSLCEKFLLFGGLIWLLHKAGLGLLSATGFTATLLVATSLAQMHLPGRSAGITDAVMTLVIGGVFVLVPSGSREYRSQ